MSIYGPSLFFSASQSVDAYIGEMFSGTWANYASLHELWWQIRGYKSVFPDATEKEIRAKFFSGGNVPGGLDISKTFLNTSWEQHQDKVSIAVVFELCSIYEAWLEDVCTDVFPTKSASNHAKSLQFPTPDAKNYSQTVAAANNNRSTFMKAQLLPTIAKKTHNCWASINEHLVAYRYFKESRNAIIHSGGNCGPKLVAAQSNFIALLAQANNPFQHKFSTPSQSLGNKIKIPLRDSILLANVVRRLICTIDAALCVSKKCEQIAIDRVLAEIKSNGKWNQIPARGKRRTDRCNSLWVSSGNPRVLDPNALESFLTVKGLV